MAFEELIINLRDAESGEYIDEHPFNESRYEAIPRAGEILRFWRQEPNSPPHLEQQYVVIKVIHDMHVSWENNAPIKRNIHGVELLVERRK